MSNDEAILGSATILNFGVAGVIRIGIESPCLDGGIGCRINFHDVLIVDVERCSNTKVLVLIEVREDLCHGFECGVSRRSTMLAESREDISHVTSDGLSEPSKHAESGEVPSLL